MSFIATIQARNAAITAQIAALVAERDENDAALRVLARFGFDTNSAASTQELPRPMEGAADRGEVRPGLAANNIAPVAMGEADAVDLMASADQSSSQPQAESGTAEIDPPDVVESEGGDDEVDAQTSQHVAPIDGDVTGARAGTGKTVGPSGSAAPSLRSRIAMLHRDHPEYTRDEAMAALDCTRGSLTGYSSLLGIKWARSPNHGGRPAKSPIEADPSAEAPEPAPEPESPPASTPEPAIAFMPPAGEMSERTAKRIEVADLHRREPWLTPDEAAARLLIPIVNLRIFTDELEIAWSQPHAASPPVEQAPLAQPRTLRDRVMAMHRMHPTWGTGMISRELGCAYGSASTYLAEARRVDKEQPPAPINREVA